jgi:hypothetical protein
MVGESGSQSISSPLSRGKLGEKGNWRRQPDITTIMDPVSIVIWLRRNSVLKKGSLWILRSLSSFSLLHPDFLSKKDEGEDYYHWHLQIIPRLTTPAGFEMGSGIYIDVSLPEETVQFLKDY